MADSRMATVEGARVAYRIHDNGALIVLVNGTAALDVHWGPVIPALAKQRTVLTLDYSGSGETTDDGSTLSLQKLANQVIGLAKAAGLDRFDLVGHSLGVAVAIQVAAAVPDLVRSITAVAGFAHGSGPRLELQFQLWLDLLRTTRMAFLRLLLLSGLTPTFVSRLGVSVLEDMINEYLPLANWDGIKRQVELDLTVDIREKTTKIRSPSLVINCTHDQIVTQTSGLAASIPNSTLRQLNVGHLAYFECGDEFLALITDFQSRRELSTPAGRRNPPVLTDGASGSTRN